MALWEVMTRYISKFGGQSIEKGMKVIVSSMQSPTSTKDGLGKIAKAFAATYGEDIVKAKVNNAGQLVAEMVNKAK